MSARLLQSRVFELASENVHAGTSLEDDLAFAFALAVGE